jgi:hypothetical protein
MSTNDNAPEASGQATKNSERTVDERRSPDPSMAEAARAPASQTEPKNSLADPEWLARYNREDEEILFVATRDELVELSRYWATEILDENWLDFLYGYSSFSDWRSRTFAWCRIDGIIELLGADRVKTVMEATKNEFGRGRTPDHWRIFNEGTAEEREALRKEERRYHPHSREKMHEFHTDLMKVLAGEPSRLEPCEWVSWANLARELIDQKPELALPVNRDELLSMIEEEDRNIHRQVMRER